MALSLAVISEAHRAALSLADATSSGDWTKRRKRLLKDTSASVMGLFDVEGWALAYWHARRMADDLTAAAAGTAR